MATAELAEVSRSIRSAMGESAGQFRQAANASAANLSKIVKDIATTFSAQRKDINDLHNSIQEGQYATEQTNDKIDGLIRIFQETASIQTTMQGYLSDISKNIRILNRNVESMNTNLSNNLVGSGTGNILSSLTTGLGSVVEKIGAAAVGGAVGYVAGGMGGGGGGATAMQPNGSSSEAMSFFQSKGWSKEQSAGIVGNLQVESENFSSAVISGKKKGDGGTAVGIAQWHPDRQARFQQIMGKPLIGSTFQDQLAFVDWELKNSEAKAGNILKMAKSAADAAAKVDEFYERSSGEHRSKRIANAERLTSSKGGETATPVTSAATTPSTTPTATPVSKPEAVPSATSPRTETIGKEGGHGPISGAMHEGQAHGEKVETSAALPSGDIVALGHALEKMGMRISEHPSFGGVAGVHKGRAHYEGRAIDINIGKGNTEATNPVLGAKFDHLADQLTRLGYKVFWRESGPYGAAGHNDHLHAELRKGGAPAVPDTYQMAGTPEQRAAQGATPYAATPSTTAPSAAPMAAPVAEPIQQAPMTTGMMGAPMGGDMTGQLMGMLGGFIPGGFGGMIGGLLPMIASAISAELTPSPSMASMNARTVSQAAVQSQAMEESAQQQTVTPTNTPSMTGGASPMSAADNSGYAYNTPDDIGWPDWASMIGGNHWEEMKHYKKNMWG
jgi:hypothetical protein